MKDIFNFFADKLFVVIKVVKVNVILNIKEQISYYIVS